MANLSTDEKEVYEKINAWYLWCVICGKPNFQRHHIKYRSQGGKTTEENILPVCKTCHDDVHAERLIIDIKKLTAVYRETGEVKHFTLDKHVPDEQLGALAYGLNTEIISTVGFMKRTWVILGKFLKCMRDSELYKVLDYDTFNSYLASPEIDLSPGHVHKLITGIEFYLEKFKVPEDVVNSIDLEKLIMLKPIVNSENVEDMLYDALELSRSDLRQKYQIGNSDSSMGSYNPHEHKCGHCGKTSRYLGNNPEPIRKDQ